MKLLQYTFSLLYFVNAEEDVKEQIKLKTVSVEGETHWDPDGNVFIPWGQYPEHRQGKGQDDPGHHHDTDSHYNNYHNHQQRKNTAHRESHKHSDQDGPNPCVEATPGVDIGNCYGKCNDRGICVERTCTFGEACSQGWCDRQGRCLRDTCLEKYWHAERKDSRFQLIGTCEGTCVQKRRRGQKESYCRYDFAKGMPRVEDPASNPTCNNANCPGECYQEKQGEPEVCTLNTCNAINCDNDDGHCKNGYCIKETCDPQINCHHGTCTGRGLCITNWWPDFNHKHGNSFDPVNQ